jgi:hypothetical protein
MATPGGGVNVPASAVRSDAVRTRPSEGRGAREAPTTFRGLLCRNGAPLALIMAACALVGAVANGIHIAALANGNLLPGAAGACGCAALRIACHPPPPPAPLPLGTGGHAASGRPMSWAFGGAATTALYAMLLLSLLSPSQRASKLSASMACFHALASLENALLAVGWDCTPVFRFVVTFGYMLALAGFLMSFSKGRTHARWEAARIVLSGAASMVAFLPLLIWPGVSVAGEPPLGRGHMGDALFVFGRGLAHSGVGERAGAAVVMVAGLSIAYVAYGQAMDDFVALVRSLSFIWSRIIAIATIASALSVSFLIWIPLVIGFAQGTPEAQVRRVGRGRGGGGRLPPPPGAPPPPRGPGGPGGGGGGGGGAPPPPPPPLPPILVCARRRWSAR